MVGMFLIFGIRGIVIFVLISKRFKFVDIFFLFDRFMIGIGGGSGGCGVGKLFLLLNWILMLCIWG